MMRSEDVPRVVGLGLCMHRQSGLQVMPLVIDDRPRASGICPPQEDVMVNKERTRKHPSIKRSDIQAKL